MFAWPGADECLSDQILKTLSIQLFRERTSKAIKKVLCVFPPSKLNDQSSFFSTHKYLSYGLSDF